MPNKFNDQGNYMANSGEFDDMNAMPEGTLSVDLSTVKGAEQYKPGDVVNFTVKGVIPQKGKGLSEIEIKSISVEPMDDSARVSRQKESIEAGY